MKRLVIWRGLDCWRAETAGVDLTASGVHATGTQLGTDPVVYRLDYTLDAAESFITRSLSVEVEGEGCSRGVRLAHDGGGGWHCESEHSGDVDLPGPGGDTEALAGANDCDLGFSPLTNIMPIRRHSLHERPGATDLLVAWVSVPDLGVLAYPQRYEHIGVGTAGGSSGSRPSVSTRGSPATSSSTATGWCSCIRSSLAESSPSGTFLAIPSGGDVSLVNRGVWLSPCRGERWSDGMATVTMSIALQGCQGLS